MANPFDQSVVCCNQVLNSTEMLRTSLVKKGDSWRVQKMKMWRTSEESKAYKEEFGENADQTLDENWKYSKVNFSQPLADWEESVVAILKAMDTIPDLQGERGKICLDDDTE
jgi:hypothetical protein